MLLTSTMVAVFALRLDWQFDDMPGRASGSGQSVRISGTLEAHHLLYASSGLMFMLHSTKEILASYKSLTYSHSGTQMKYCAQVAGFEPAINSFGDCCIRQYAAPILKAAVHQRCLYLSDMLSMQTPRRPFGLTGDLLPRGVRLGGLATCRVVKGSAVPLIGDGTPWT